MKKAYVLILIFTFISPFNLALSSERVCFDTKDIENIKFKKDYLLFKNRKN